MIHSSEEVKQAGDVISTSSFNPHGWFPASVPSTVLATLMANGVYKEPYFGMNLKKIPEKPFKQPWWYRTEFQLSQSDAAKTVLLEFDGINYCANIWLNGHQIATSSEVKGTYRRFQFDVSRFVCEGENVLALEVDPPKPGDFSIGFVDWNPPPPDRNMGLYRSVRLRLCNHISIENPFVQTQLNLETLEEATITISAELANHTDRAVFGVLKGKVESIQFEKSINIEPQNRKIVKFTDLKLVNPRLWWPHNLGKPNLYDLQLKFSADCEVCDVTRVRFGIRHVEAYTNETGHKGFKINGKKVLIKAAGWTDDLFLADTPETIDAQLKYVKHMNLNGIRLEGIWGTDQTLYDLCDKYGILIMVGWSCHWEHEQYLGKPVAAWFQRRISSWSVNLGETRSSG